MFAALLLPGLLGFFGLHGMARTFSGPLVYVLVAASLFVVLYFLARSSARR